MTRIPATATAFLDKCRAIMSSDKLAALRAGIGQAIFLQKTKQLPIRLSALSRALRASTKNEDRFLDMGRTLQAIYTDTSDLITFIRETIQSVMNETDENILGKAQDLARRAETALTRHQERVTDSLTRIKMVADHLAGLHQACDQLGRIAMNLRVVGLNIGVESTRSAEGREMFTVVAQEILRLSETVNENAAAIRADATEATSEQMTAFETISDGLQMLAELMTEAAGVVESAVAETDRCVNGFVKAFEIADGRFREISSRVGEIVMGIQFHDNMRQRVEHITAALDASGQTLGGKDSETDGKTAMTAFLDRWDRKREAIGNACATVSLQKAQLKDVISEIDRVHRESVAAFEEMGREVQELAGTMSAENTDPGAVGGAQTVSSDPFSKLTDALTGLCGMLNQGDALGRRIMESISRASEISRRFSHHLKNVDRISFETKIKALNAIVKAGHMSEEGRTLEVLAQEMNRLSQQTNRFVDHVGEKLTKVGQFGEDSELKESDDADTQSKHELFDISEAMTRGIDELVRMRSQMNQRSTEASEKAAALRETVSRTVSELNFLTALARETSMHLDTLDNIDRQLADASKKWKMGKRAGMEKLVDSYTMQRERTVHHNAFLSEKAQQQQIEAGPAPPEEPEPEADISLWDDFGEPPPPPPPDSEPETDISLWDDFEEPPRKTSEESGADNKDEEEDFGDNIELF